MDDAIRSRLLRVRKIFFLSSSAVSSYIDAKSDRNRERGKEKARQEKKTLHDAQLLWGGGANHRSVDFFAKHFCLKVS